MLLAVGINTRIVSHYSPQCAARSARANIMSGEIRGGRRERGRDAVFLRARGELGLVRLEEAEPSRRRRRPARRRGALRYFKGRGRRLLEALEQRTPKADGGRHDAGRLVGALGQ